MCAHCTRFNSETCCEQELFFSPSWTNALQKFGIAFAPHHFYTCGQHSRLETIKYSGAYNSLLEVIQQLDTWQCIIYGNMYVLIMGKYQWCLLIKKGSQIHFSLPFFIHFQGTTRSPLILELLIVIYNFKEGCLQTNQCST